MIRKFDSADVHAVIDIWLNASIKAHPFIDASFWRSKTEDMRTIYLPASNTYVYQEEEKGPLLGFISLVNNDIAAIFVNPDYQGAGIGKELIDFTKKSYPQLRLCVYSKNVGAIEFYKKQGFSILEERQERNTGELELVMEYNSNL